MEEKKSLHTAALRTVVAAVLLSASGLAAAGEPGFYVGLVGGQSKTEIDQSDSDDLIASEFGPVLRSSVKETDTGFGGFIGYQFIPWLAVEVAYHDLGEASYRADTSLFIPFPVSARIPVNTEIKSEVTAASASALLMAPLGDQFSVGVRLGVATTKSKFSVTAAAPGISPETLSDSMTNTSGVFGVNAQWNVSPQIGLRLEYQRYKDVGGDSDEDIDGFDVTLLSLAATWHF